MADVTDAETILAVWFGGAAADPAVAAAREGFWFGASPEADALVRDRFSAAVEAAARGELESWLDAARPALALVLLLDQFPRNLWRGTARAFAQDAQGLRMARAAVARGHLPRLAPLEQAFLVLPYQHSESAEDQREALRLVSGIVRAAPPAWHPLLDRYREVAEQHRALIEQFGRFPHRNRILGRATTPEEDAYLAGGGVRFGQEAR